MKRTLGIDYGTKRCGLARTDALGLMAHYLDPCATADLLARLDALATESPFERIVLGLPQRFDLRPTHSTEAVLALAQELRERYPDVEIVLWDERLTSKLARQTLHASGLPRRRREQKDEINSVSAILILQNYLDSRT
jgi:putative Holliday junction resolvase